MIRSAMDQITSQVTQGAPRQKFAQAMFNEMENGHLHAWYVKEVRICTVNR